MNLRERFETKVSPEPTSGCHLWTGGMLPNGYGMVWHDGRNHGAHRVAWELSGGTIQDDQVIDHLCHNKACVNPAHLRATTPRGNSSNYAGKEDGKFSSRHVGVSWSKRSLKWKASIYADGHLKHLGFFDDEQVAAAKYRTAAEQISQHAVRSKDAKDVS